MQLRGMPRGGQINLKGNVVNVPSDVNNTVRQWSSMLDDSEIIAVKIKRKLCYKHHVSYEKVRPNKVKEAAKWLVQNRPLFKSEGIVVDDLWVGTPRELENDETVIVSLTTLVKTNNPWKTVLMTKMILVNGLS
jgi:hypothetical protein